MHRNPLSLLVVCSILLATSLPAAAQQSLSQDVNIFGLGASIVNGIINPPHRAAEITADAEIKKAKIAAQVELEKEKLRIAASADKVTPILNRWGVNRVICAPNLAVINGLDENGNAVCIQPSSMMTAGYYVYDHSKQILLKTSQTIQPIDSNTRLTAVGTSSSKGF